MPKEGFEASVTTEVVLMDCGPTMRGQTWPRRRLNRTRTRPALKWPSRAWTME